MMFWVIKPRRVISASGRSLSRWYLSAQFGNGVIVACSDGTFDSAIAAQRDMASRRRAAEVTGLPFDKLPAQPPPIEELTPIPLD